MRSRDIWEKVGLVIYLGRDRKSCLLLAYFYDVSHHLRFLEVSLHKTLKISVLQILNVVRKFVKRKEKSSIYILK